MCLHCPRPIHVLRPITIICRKFTIVVELTVNSMIVIFSGQAMSHLSLNSGSCFVLLNLLYKPNVQPTGSEQWNYNKQFVLPCSQITQKIHNLTLSQSWHSKNGHFGGQYDGGYESGWFKIASDCVWDWAWDSQWQIQNFPEVEAPTLRGGPNIQFCQIFPKTAWNWKNLDRGGGARVQNFTM